MNNNGLKTNIETNDSAEKIEKVIRDNLLQLQEIKDKFKSWRFNIFACTIFYIIVFLFADIFLRKLGKDDNSFLGKWLVSSRRKENRNVLPIILLAIFQGVIFIIDSIIVSYLKTPLQRVSVKLENSFIEDKKKGKILRFMQESNEHFKETFKKFGIIVITFIIADILNGKSTERGSEPSETYWYYIAFLVPISFALFRIWKVENELNKIKKNLEQRC